MKISILHKCLLFVTILILASCKYSSRSETVTKLELAYSYGTCQAVLPLSQEDINIHEKNGLFFYYKGLCEKKTGNLEQAKFDLLKAMDLNVQPEAAVWLNLGGVEALLKNPEQAFFYLNRLNRINLKNNTTLFERKDFDSIRDYPEFQKILHDFRPFFDVWSAIFLFIMVQGIITAILISFFTKNKKKGIILLLFLVFSMTISSNILYWSGYQHAFPYLRYWRQPFIYLSGPLIYLYLRNNILNSQLSKHDLLHLIPSIFFAILLIPILLSNYLPFDRPKEWRVLIELGSNNYSKILHLGVYLFLSFKVASTKLPNSPKIKRWGMYLTLAFAGYFILYLVYFILFNLKFYSPMWDYYISLAISFFILVVVLIGYLMPSHVSDEIEITQTTSKPTAEKYSKNKLPLSVEEKLKQKLILLMSEELVYTDGELRLNDLSKMTGYSPHNVSMVVNKHFGSFANFINNYRVEHVKRLIQDPAHRRFTLIEIAYQAGFNNKVSFNMAFKKVTGITPSSFRKQSQSSK